MTKEEYASAFEDGVAAASDKIATFFTELKMQHVAHVAELQAANRAMEKLVLDKLAPLQDVVRKLKPLVKA